MIKTTNLSPILDILAPAVQGNKIMPILNCIKAKSIDGTKKIRLTSSNLEMQIEVDVDAEIENDFSLCIDYAKLSQFSKSNKGIDLSIKAVQDYDDRIKLKSKSTSTIQTLPSNTYPDMMVESNNSIDLELDVNSFWMALNSISHSAGINDIRHFLNGVNFRLENQILTLTCSDGHRLSTVSIYVECDYDLAINCIIPLKTAQTLAKTFAKSEGKLNLSINNNSFSAGDESIKITGKNVDSKYPDFAKVFDVERLNHAIVDNKEFISGIESVMITAREISRAIVLTFADNNIHVVAENQNGEISIADIECEYFGDDVEIGVNAEYLVQSAKKVDGNISVNLDNSAQNLTLTEVDNDKSVTHLIMQMRV